MKRAFFFLFGLSLILLMNLSFAQEEESYEEYKNRQQDREVIVEDEATTTDRVDDGKGWSWQNFRLGGNFGLQFGQRTYIELSPIVGYQINKWLQLGVTSKFIYFSQRNDLFFTNGSTTFVTPAFKTIIGGFGSYAQVFPFKDLYLHTEYELINKEPFNPNRPENRINVSHLLLGAGYAIPMGQAGSFNIAALINVLDNEESIYSGTFGGLPLIIRMGANFGFGGGR